MMVFVVVGFLYMSIRKLEFVLIMDRSRKFIVLFVSRVWLKVRFWCTAFACCMI
jgi:hypothetical protein